MKKYLFLHKTGLALFVLVLWFNNAEAQNIGINTTGATPDASAMLDIVASDKGLLIPRMTNAQKNAISSPATGLLIYQTDAPIGFWYYNGTIWTQFGGGSGWSLTGDAGTVDGTNFIGTTDNIPFNIRVNNTIAGRIDNTNLNAFFGYNTGNSSTTGTKNTAIGSNTFLFNTTGSNNAALGYNSLAANTAGNNNNAFGINALAANTTGNNNNAFGNGALALNTTGGGNAAFSYGALAKNTTGGVNCAFGGNAMNNNTTGSFNSGLGVSALALNTTGGKNTALGYNALASNVAGSNATAVGTEAMFYANNQAGAFTNTNVAVGYQSLYGSFPASANTGINNTAIGYQTLWSNSSGGDNTALGYNAGKDGATHSQCTFIGAGSTLTTNRSNVTLLGYGIINAQCTGNNQVCLGNTATTDLRAAVTGITAYSDARFKTNIKENVSGLNFILKLKPVTYNVRPKELNKIWGTPDSLVNKIDYSDAEKETRIGFIAQDVQIAAKASSFDFPGIDVPRNEREVYTLRYTDFIMPMVKAIQELNEKIIVLEKENQTLKELILKK